MPTKANLPVVTKTEQPDLRRPQPGDMVHASHRGAYPSKLSGMIENKIANREYVDPEDEDWIS